MIRINNNDFSYECDCNTIIKKNIIIFYESKNNKSNFYTRIKLDKKNRTISFFQDDLGDTVQYYYATISNNIYIDKSIKSIIKKLKERIFDNESLYYFLSCGFIPNEKTLVEGINKVVPGCINIYNVDTFTLALIDTKLNKKKMLPFSEKKYKKLLLNNIKENFNNNLKTGFAISSGFDSNLLISLFNKNIVSTNKYFSVGGVKGVNEIPTVEKILNHYQYNDLNYSIVNNNSLDNYPRIVYLYEGLFYERGIFLQYQLYSLLKEENLNIILGEGADQILHIKSTINNNIKKSIKMTNYSLYKNCPKEILNYIVLKKSSILLSSTKNNVIYPYLSSKFRHYNYNYKHLFGYDKIKHKDIVKKEVGSKISKMLNKIGGATDQEALFLNKNDYSVIKNIALNSSFAKILCEHNTTELSLEVDYILKLIYLLIFEKLFMLNNDYFDNINLVDSLNIQNLS